MSDMYAVAQNPTEVALAAAVAKTVLQITAPANHRVRVKSWGIFFDGISATAEPVQVRLIRQTSAGTMTALTPSPIRPISETLLTTAQVNATAEPTNAGDSTVPVDVIQCHPQTGYEVAFNPGDEIIIPGGGRLGIECTAPAIVNCRAKIRFEE